jgi:hypothetical protein
MKKTGLVNPALGPLSAMLFSLRMARESRKVELCFAR